MVYTAKSGKKQTERETTRSVCETYLLSLAVLIEAINSLRIVPHRFNNIFAASALSRFAL